MGVETKTVTVYTCDRCAYETRKPLERQGYTVLTIEETLVAVGGDVGGGTHKVWLCGYCAGDHRNFMLNNDVAGRTNA